MNIPARFVIQAMKEERLKVFVWNWHKDSQSQSKVGSTIEGVLDKDLPESYGRVTFKKKCDQVYELIYEYASKGLKWAA